MRIYLAALALILTSVVGGIGSAYVHAQPPMHPTLLGVYVAYLFGALVCGVGVWVLAGIVHGFTGRWLNRWHADAVAREQVADLDTVLRFTRGHR